MAQIPNLDNAPLNLTSLREQSQKDLLTILKNIGGNKCLVLDQQLSGSLSLIIETSILKEHGGVTEFRHLSSKPVQTECTKVVYLIRSQLNLVKLISAHIQNDISKGTTQREYYVYFVPRRTVPCEKIFDEEKVHHLLTIGEYPLYMIPMDEDVLSFELDHLAYRDYLYSFGVIPNVIAKGKASARIAEILTRMQVEEEPSNILHVDNGCVEIDASIIGNQQQQGKKTKVPLNSSDKTFKKTRDLNFKAVAQVLHQNATDMRQDYKEFHTANQSVTEVKDYVRKLNSSFPEVKKHVNLSQHLTTFTSKPSFSRKLNMELTVVEGESYGICFEYIEEMIHRQEPVVEVLRLLVLFSSTNLGLPKEQFDYIRREFLHSYGFEHMTTLCDLEKAGLFKKHEVKGNNWLTIKRALNLVVEDSNDTANPNDIAYVFSGYAPLSVRLVQHAVRSEWRPIEDILKLLPGPHSENKRDGRYPSTPSFDTLAVDVQDSSYKVVDGKPSLALVVFVGGVTFAEISALRYLSAQEGMVYDLIVGTTKMVNGHTIIKTFLETIG
ncbi:hypothetical protein MKW92_047189 [Papaver armeniacum]|nr:hypothetical protein MKW92_047189 [Papaver armeniacum]